MKIMISACLAGENCKYNGGNNRNEKVLHLMAENEVMKVCPEQMGGLPTPRPPAEQQGDRVINTDGIVKLTDLGLCHTYKYLQDVKLDVPDHVMGTPAYISPEQVYGDVEPDCRSDIYSLAASLYHLATGRVIFPGLDSEGMMRSHCSEEAQGHDPRAYRPELSEGFCQLLEAMLVKNRDYRIPSWSDICSMCLNVEQGGAFKPRKDGFSSSIKLTASLNACAAQTADNSVKPPRAPKKNLVTKLFRSAVSRRKIEKDPVTGKTVLKKKSAAVNPKFKIHRPADW